MDHQTFDHVTRVFAASGSRRAAWRALLGAALLGATTRTAMAGPCDTDNNPQCTCGAGTKCPPGKCFLTCQEGKERAFCCTGRDPKARGELIICGDKCCLDNGSAHPCEDCQLPNGVGQPTGAGVPCTTYVGGSYRRR